MAQRLTLLPGLLGSKLNRRLPKDSEVEFSADQILSCITMVVTRLQARQVSTSVLSSLPLFMRSPVVQGMRRGGKELGVPTGNTKLSTLVYTLAV